MRKILISFFSALLLCHQIGFAKNKILVICELNTLQNLSSQGIMYMYQNAVSNFDYKITETIPWTNSGVLMDQWQALRDLLQDEYFEAINAGDDLEGAVLIGDVCVPQAAENIGGGILTFYPMDHFCMDIVDKSSSPPVAYSNDHTPFTWTSPYYFDGSYSGGDEEYDIWVSRINATNMPTLREGYEVKDEYQIYRDYLIKVVDRMKQPASVPSRGFVMGGPIDHDPLPDILGCMNILDLPWYAEFEGAEQNTPYNWMSQLLAGPRGTITYGAFNGTLFPTNERNGRSCLYNTLNVSVNGSAATATTISPVDCNGWEWAGLYNHSSSVGSTFGCNFSESFPGNGMFRFGTLGPSITLDDRMSNGGYNGEYFRYFIDPEVANPYYPYCSDIGIREKWAKWRMPINTSGDYEIFLSYVPSDDNDKALAVTLHELRVNSNGVPESPITNYVNTAYPYNQRRDVNELPTSNLRNKYPGCWQRITFNVGTATNPIPLTSVYLTASSVNDRRMAVVTLNLDQHTTDPVYRIADAVLFLRDGVVVEDIIDDSDPATYLEPENESYQVLSGPGFAFSDYINRYYEDMGSEPGGGGYSKTQFFMLTACEINNFLEYKNIGSMYALGHNGLISMGAAGPDHTEAANQTIRVNYFEALSTGMDFGQAFIYALNQVPFATQYSWRYREYYNLLGAGSLRAQPYIQYGTTITENWNINSGYTSTSMMPMLIRDVSVSDNGSWDVTCSNTPFGTYSEIVVRPETVLSPAGSNEVHLIVN